MFLGKKDLLSTNVLNVITHNIIRSRARGMFSTVGAFTQLTNGRRGGAPSGTRSMSVYLSVSQRSLKSLKARAVRGRKVPFD